MIQEQLLSLPPAAPRVVEIPEDEKQRALEGLPHYWKLDWGFADAIMADCGKHMLRTRVEWLEDPEKHIFTGCPYKELGGCT